MALRTALHHIEEREGCRGEGALPSALQVGVGAGLCPYGQWGGVVQARRPSMTALVWGLLGHTGAEPTTPKRRSPALPVYREPSLGHLVPRWNTTHTR